MGNDHCGVLELPTMLIDYSMDNIIEGSGFLLVFHLQYPINIIWVIINGWWFQTCFFPFHIYGMSSFPLTSSYFSRWLLHHQPDYTYIYRYRLY